ncbi:flagellar biosynthetic protein FliR [Candidatus Koribacter versatilis Ellin345]|uniref:Flagellar biosynthetic protein FliR n=1 Tax=Koribacter versatilis (strain Ellin345) TaxID=204669 RepID=Q1IR58_KORVE|nr:flagellar biosynthetic protein FliR [Candidatus Koribacter versatilis]ABF40642.1 flagellar biosynthetic protein FliR [Candidatus Koribacter versatilis Ellin345]
MEPLEVWVQSIVLVGTRIAALVLFAPFFSHAAIPPRVKGGLVVLLTILLYPSVISATVLSASEVVGVVLHETFIGMLIGLSSVLVFEAVQFAGQCLGIEVGLSLVSVLDPQTQADSPVLSVLLQTILLLLFLDLNVHHWLLRALADSYRLIPPGAGRLTGVVVQDLFQQAGMIFALGVQIAAPVLAATLLADIVFAFLAKASPQMPVLLLGMPVKFVLGLTTLWAGLRFWPVIFDRNFALALQSGERWLHLAR